MTKSSRSNLRTKLQGLAVWFGSWMICAFVMLIRWTQRVRYHNDPRDILRANSKTYIYSFLHAHQLCMTICSEKGAGAMVSQSADGQLIVPALEMIGCVPVRGSKWRANGAKGGRKAIDALTDHVAGGRPAAIAVDGPRGPRGRVHKGVAAVSHRTGTAVINVVAVNSFKIVLSRTWDRMEIPLPFGHVDGYFADPIYPQEGEKLEAYRKRIEESLQALERKHCPRPADFVAAEKMIGSEYKKAA